MKLRVWDGDIACNHEWVDEKKIINVGSSLKSTLRNGKGREQTEKYTSTSREVQTNFCLKCGAWKGSLGLEPTFDLFIRHLCDIFDEVKRVLKKEGTCWVNLGDTYSGNKKGKTDKKISDYLKEESKSLHKKATITEKNLCLIPFRFALEMQNRGWILRNVIIWHKPNCMPSSVKSRFTVDFEYVFFFVKNKKYYFERQYEPLKESSLKRAKYNSFSKKTDKGIHGGMTLETQLKIFRKISNGEMTGRNKRTVWTIPTQPFREAHFATYPKKLIEPMIKAGCPEFICNNCGKARGKITEVFYIPEGKSAKSQVKTLNREGTGNGLDMGCVRPQEMKYGRATKITRQAGYTDCGCNAGFHPGIVLDPFSGSGTTLAVSKGLGRHYLGIDLNPEYIKMAQRRVAELDETKNT